MKPKISLITLGVDDLKRSLKFYRDGLGLQTKGIVGTEFVGDDQNAAGAVVMFELRGGDDTCALSAKRTCKRFT